MMFAGPFANNVGPFADNVVPFGFLFANNLGRRSSYLWVGLIMFAGRNSYRLTSDGVPIATVQKIR